VEGSGGGYLDGGGQESVVIAPWGTRKSVATWGMQRRGEDLSRIP